MKLRPVDGFLLVAGLLAIAVGFMSLDDWIDIAISMAVWIVGMVSLGVGMQPVLALIKARHQQRKF